MNFLDIPQRNFLLHESSINGIDCENSELILNFNEGFWNTNHNQLKNCKIVISIKNLNSNNIDCFVSINGRGIFNRQISYSDFVKKIKKESFVIDVEYYSEFERSILLFGRILGKEYELKITDIQNLSFLFE